MTIPDEVKPILREAAEWRLIGLLFECPTPQWSGEVAAISRELEDPLLRQASEEALCEATEGLYHSTFGPGGPAPPREASYHDTIQLGYLISELESYYNAFAYRPACGEPADHIATEAGFIAYLKLKQAFALSEQKQESAAIVSDAAAHFLKEHLAMIAEPLAASLAASGVEYLHHASDALYRRTGRAPALPVLQDPLVSSDDCMECGV